MYYIAPLWRREDCGGDHDLNSISADTVVLLDAYIVDSSSATTKSVFWGEGGGKRREEVHT